MPVWLLDPRVLAIVIGVLVIFGIAWVIEGLLTGEWRSVLTSARRNPRIVVEIGVVAVVVVLCVVAIIQAEGN